MKRLWGILAIALLIVLAGCSSENNENRTEFLTETVITPDENDKADLDSGTAVFFPAGTFTESTIILISDTLIGEEIDAALFPTGGQTVLGALILNSPVDTMFYKNVVFTFNLNEEQTPGSTWRIYKYDDVNRAWVEIEGIVAFADASGFRANCTMPSSGVKGYSGSFALFQELPSDQPPNNPPEFGETGITTDSELVSGSVIVFRCEASDPDGDALTFDWGDGDADHGTFDNPDYADGIALVEWTTDAPGEYVITLQVSDGAGVPVSTTGTFTVT